MLFNIMAVLLTVSWLYYRSHDLCDVQLEVEAAVVSIDQYIDSLPSTASASSAPAITDPAPAAAEHTAQNGVEVAAVKGEQAMEVDEHDQPAMASSTAVQDAAVSHNSDPEELQLLLRALIARLIQGSSQNLTALIVSTQTSLTTITARLRDIPSSSSSSASPSDHTATRRAMVIEELTKLSESTKLAESIKTLADRESWRIKAKTSAQYDETDELAIWRWDVKILSYFPKSVQGILREAKVHRGRYRRLVKAYYRVIEQLLKSGPSKAATHSVTEDSTTPTAATEHPKLTPLLESVATLRIELNKAKDRRKETERRRLEEQEAKRLKDEKNELKRKEKEHQAQLKQQSALSEADAAHAACASLFGTSTAKSGEDTKAAPKLSAAAEKKLKEKEEKDKALEKQRQLLQGFFHKKPTTDLISTTIHQPSSSSSSSAVAGAPAEQVLVTRSCPVLSLDDDGAVIAEDLIVTSELVSPPSQLSQHSIDLTGTAAVATHNPNIPLVGAVKVTAQHPWQRVSVDLDAFERSFNKDLDHKEITRQNKRRYSIPYFYTNLSLYLYYLTLFLLTT